MSKNVEDYLRSYSVLDGMGNMDGSFVPLSVAMLAVEQVINGKLEYMGKSWHLTKKAQLEQLIKEYSSRYPCGEFSFLASYSACERYVTGVLCWDYKLEIYHIEGEPIDDVIKLIKSLKKRGKA